MKKYFLDKAVFMSNTHYRSLLPQKEKKCPLNARTLNFKFKRFIIFKIYSKLELFKDYYIIRQAINYSYQAGVFVFQVFFKSFNTRNSEK